MGLRLRLGWAVRALSIAPNIVALRRNLFISIYSRCSTHTLHHTPS